MCDTEFTYLYRSPNPNVSLHIKNKDVNTRLSLVSQKNSTYHLADVTRFIWKPGMNSFRNANFCSESGCRKIQEEILPIQKKKRKKYTQLKIQTFPKKHF